MNDVHLRQEDVEKLAAEMEAKRFAERDVFVPEAQIDEIVKSMKNALLMCANMPTTIVRSKIPDGFRLTIHMGKFGERKPYDPKPRKPISGIGFPLDGLQGGDGSGVAVS